MCTSESYSSQCSSDSLIANRYGLVGILRPLTVYPSEMVYWSVSPFEDFFSVKVIKLYFPNRIYPLLRFSKVTYFFVSFNLHRINSSCVAQALHFDSKANYKRLKLFWISFAGMFVYEIFPAYIFPLLNGINIFCLASQKASPRIVDIFTNLFGGTDANEGLGFFSISLDWQYIGSM